MRGYPQTFVSGRRVRWGALASVLVAGPVYAWYEGLVGSVRGVGAWVQSVLDGVRAFMVGFLDLLFGSGATAISRTWWAYWVSARSTFGPASWFVTVVVTLAVMWLFLKGVRRVV